MLVPHPAPREFYAPSLHNSTFSDPAPLGLAIILLVQLSCGGFYFLFQAIELGVRISDLNYGFRKEYVLVVGGAVSCLGIVVFVLLSKAMGIYTSEHLVLLLIMLFHFLQLYYHMIGVAQTLKHFIH